ncbi:MAG: hypothetical protein H6742_20285 [Alphaproteobacteria bacterium]|nr:hypothetical protein [Alphaproteobacteria bacterium]
MTLLLPLLLACVRDPFFSAVPQDSGTDTPGPMLVPLDDVALARRISIDLRGVAPSIEELDRVQADPAALDRLVDEWLVDPRHESRLVDLFADRWKTRVDALNVPASDFDLADRELDFLRSVEDEPLRLLAWVGARDLPWTEIVQADHTMANDTLLSMWDLSPVDDLDPGADGWVPARYGDARPPGGVLMSNGLWWRYTSTLNNFNRGRANALTELLLCHDHLTRPVAFEGVTDFTTEALEEAIRTNEGCVSCHSSVDPVASALFGFWWYDDKDATEMSRYHPEREPLGADWLGQPAAISGVPVTGAGALGTVVAADPRFLPCAVEQVAEALWGRRHDADDLAVLDDLRDAFVDGDLRLSALIRATLATDAYRAGALGEGADDALAAAATTRRLMGPELLADVVEDLTGHRWTFEGYDQLTNDIVGYRVMAGGVDGLVVLRPDPLPTLTRSLVIRRLAQAAAADVVASDGAIDSGRRLFRDGDDLAALTPDDEAWRAQVVQLHRRILGTVPDDDRVADLAALYTAVSDAADPDQAWASVVSLMLRDPAFWSY